VGHDELSITARVAGALLIGAIIGFERTFHGRPAGFRTHALVCIASALLMIVTVYQSDWMTQVTPEAIRTDPTRMAQGIMTGIGFLGAGERRPNFAAPDNPEGGCRAPRDRLWLHAPAYNFNLRRRAVS
jgi:hypothetical protein